MNKQILAETRRELEEWPGATLTQENSGKHGRVVLHYKGESRIVVVSNTPSDARVIKNHISLVRRELRGLGAVRRRVAVSGISRERNKPVRVAMPSLAAPVRQNPFEQLEVPTMTKTNPIDAIFTAIEQLTYAQMIDFCSVMSDASEVTGLKRKDPYSWARTFQFALDARSESEEAVGG